MKTAFLTLFLAFALPAVAANNAVNLACKRLCSQESECVKKCVSHSELFELRGEFIDAAADFSSSVETRMRVLRTGASLDMLPLCKGTGWSLENMMICLRSYPTPDVVKGCKKLSPLEEDQVKCVRSGKSSAEVEACSNLFTDSSQSLRCLGMKVTAQETRECRKLGWNTERKMDCLIEAEASRKRDADEFEKDTKKRLAEEELLEKDGGRKPASY